jgi:hypothetical protein
MVVLKRKNKRDWEFKWDGKDFSYVSHYGNKYRINMSRQIVEFLKGNQWVNDWKINDIVRAEQAVLQLG